MAAPRTLVLLMLGLRSTWAAAEPAAPPAASRWQRLSVSWTHGLPFGGTEDSLETAMRLEGYAGTDRSCGFLNFFCEHPDILIGYPRTHRLGTPFNSLALRAHYTLSRRIGIAFAGAYAPLQWTEGFAGGRGSSLDVESRVTALAPLLTVGSDEAVWFGIGPSINFLSLATESQGRASATAPGAVIEAGIRQPAVSRVFFEALGQYRYVRPVRMSPPFYERAHEIGFSHFSLQAGIGVRFGADRPEP